MTILRNPFKILQRQVLQKQDWLLLTCALAGLMALTGLIYREGVTPVQAASSPNPVPISVPGSIQSQAQITTQNTITPLDVVVVFDVSASMEDQTICHDCFVRTSYNPDWPNNGYFNPIPYDKALADNNPGTGNQSVPASALCTVYPPQPFITDTLQYLTIEAELYSRNVGDWGLAVRTPGQGFWTIQRGSKVAGNNILVAGTNLQGGVQVAGEDNDQRNAAGDPTQQSSNVCQPNTGGIDCTVGGSNDDICSSADGGIAVDCSAYLAARPFGNYTGLPGNIPRLNGAAYNADCFSGNILSDACWSNNPFAIYPPLGLTTGPSNVPWVEYDFTPTWSEDTHIWIRAIGGGTQAFTWAGSSPDQIQPDVNGGGPNDNITPWRKVIYWQVDNGIIDERKDNLNSDYSNSPDDFNSSSYFQGPGTWRDNRAENDDWRWIMLGSTATVSGTQATLKLYQGSAGYKVDKIVFTNDSSGSTPEGSSTVILPAVLRRNASGGTASGTDYGNQLGPPASFGSATREACNVCNPIYGYTVNPSQCNCKRNATESDYGTGVGCTLVTTTTNQLQAELPAGLYSGLQPLRSAQEAVKHLARQLDPRFDQLGFVPFTGGQDNTDAQSDPNRRAKLQCLVRAAQQSGNPAYCYDTNLGIPISYTAVLSAVERHWPESGTNIAIGVREGLEELGINVPGVITTTSGACSTVVNDGNACDRGGAAKRVIILMTDGIPNGNPGNCNGSSGSRPDLWDGLLGAEDSDFECATYYAYLAAQNNVSFYTIGIGSGPEPDLLTEMATGIDPRGGEPDWPMFAARCGQYFSAAKPTDLKAIFDTIISQARSCNSAGPYLEITKSSSPNPVAAGEVLTYTLTVANNLAVHSLNDLIGIVITDVLDSNITFVSASDGGIHNSRVITWNVDVITAGQNISRTLVVAVGNLAHGSILTNTAYTTWVTSTGSISHSTIATTTIIHQPPGNITITGPTSGFTGTSYVFTATTNPVTATTPLTYLWQATGQTPVTHTGGLSDTAGFAWGIIGPQVVTVTTTNGGGTVMDTHTITILSANCANPLSESSFETVPPVKWLGIGTQGVLLAAGNSHTGNFGLLADTLRGSLNSPFLYQSFTVPASLITSTPSIRLNLFKNVVNEVNGPDPNDRFYVVLATGPALTSPQVTEPMLVATGVGADSYSPANWQELNLMLSAASGINLADYAGQDLYLQFYNTSNTQAGCPPICNDTQFYFDDVNLTVCVPVAPPQTSAPAQVQPGNVFTYTITVANTGSAAATGVVVTDLLDDKLSFVSASNSGQHDNGLVTWAVGGLPVGQIITRTLAVTVGNVVSGTLLSNTVRVTSTEGLSYTAVITTRVSISAAPPASSSYLPIILKGR